MMEVMEERKVRRLNLNLQCCRRNPQRKAGNEKKKYSIPTLPHMIVNINQSWLNWRKNHNQDQKQPGNFNVTDYYKRLFIENT